VAEKKRRERPEAIRGARLPVAVMAGPIRDGDQIVNLKEETRLAKVALLYADETWLVSPGLVTILASMGLLQGGRATDVEELLRDADHTILKGKYPKDFYAEFLKGLYRVLGQQEDKTAAEWGVLGSLRNVLGVGLNDGDVTPIDWYVQAGGLEILQAVRAGALHVHLLGMEEPGAEVDRRGAFYELLGAAIAPDSDMYPLFDDATAHEVREVLKHGPHKQLASKRQIVLPSISRGSSQVAMAAHFLAHIEAFPDAPMSAVLEARDGLKEPLMRFRVAISEMASSLQTTALDEDFASTSEELFRRTAEPAIRELEEISEELKIRSLLTNSAMTGGGRRVAEAVLSFAAATAAQIPGLVASAVGVGADVATDIYTKRRDLLRQQRTNGFFFLLQAGRQLSRKSKR